MYTISLLILHVLSVRAQKDPYKNKKRKRCRSVYVPMRNSTIVRSNVDSYKQLPNAWIAKSLESFFSIVYFASNCYRDFDLRWINQLYETVWNINETFENILLYVKPLVQYCRNTWLFKDPLKFHITLFLIVAISCRFHNLMLQRNCLLAIINFYPFI